jgi:hypothetical protein
MPCDMLLPGPDLARVASLPLDGTVAAAGAPLHFPATLNNV